MDEHKSSQSSTGALPLKRAQFWGKSRFHRASELKPLSQEVHENSTRESSLLTDDALLNRQYLFLRAADSPSLTVLRAGYDGLNIIGAAAILPLIREQLSKLAELRAKEPQRVLKLKFPNVGDEGTERSLCPLIHLQPVFSWGGAPSPGVTFFARAHDGKGTSDLTSIYVSKEMKNFGRRRSSVFRTRKIQYAQAQRHFNLMGMLENLPNREVRKQQYKDEVKSRALLKKREYVTITSKHSFLCRPAPGYCYGDESVHLDLHRFDVSERILEALSWRASTGVKVSVSTTDVSLCLSEQ